MSAPTRAEVDRLGRRLRERGEIAPEDRELYARFRDGYQDALDEVKATTERVAAEVGISDRSVSTRLKRLETLVLKLWRKNYALSRFHDIAGCRLIVPTLSDVRRIQEPLFRELDVHRFRDYHDGRADGYRAWHLIVRANGGQIVELQVRSRLQDHWANTSESLAFAIDHAIKSGGGPPELRPPLQILSAWGWALDTRRAALLDQIRGWEHLRMLLLEAGDASPASSRLTATLDTMVRALSAEDERVEDEIGQHQTASEALRRMRLDEKDRR